MATMKQQIEALLAKVNELEANQATGGKRSANTTPENAELIAAMKALYEASERAGLKLTTAGSGKSQYYTIRPNQPMAGYFFSIGKKI